MSKVTKGGKTKVESNKILQKAEKGRKLGNSLWEKSAMGG
jgi:hypothetical protein